MMKRRKRTMRNENDANTESGITKGVFFAAS